MATATATATVDLATVPDQSERYFGIFFTIAVSAGPDTYATGGLALTLAVKNCPAGAKPAAVFIWSDTAANGYQFQYVPGTKISDGKLVIRASVTVANGTGPVTVEMTNGTAIPAAISSDTKLRALALFQIGK